MNVLVKSSNGITQVSADAKLLSQRKVFIEGEISPETACEFIKKIIVLNAENQEKFIDVLINSPAGEYSLSDDKIKSKIENANKIYVMYNGKIVQQYDYSGNGINIKIDADGQYRVVASNGETEADVTEYLEGEVHVDNDIYK